MPLSFSAVQTDLVEGVEAGLALCRSMVAHKPVGSTDPMSNDERWRFQELTDLCGMFDIKLG